VDGYSIKAAKQNVIYLSYNFNIEVAKVFSINAVDFQQNLGFPKNSKSFPSITTNEKHVLQEQRNAKIKVTSR